MCLIARGPAYTINGVSDSRKPYLEVRNSTYHGSGPREEARAMCSVKTAEVLEIPSIEDLVTALACMYRRSSSCVSKIMTGKGEPGTCRPAHLTSTR
ncbi:Uncharacterized protein OBRU01_13317 [Operophtera brumata]|uniref:Uncharacterized protein n=1 Tax=Operophtera brumata TaxID=104452 RepID=A0A0L7L8K9_OPEBR|nr:Uncharacterized protein OBRU01_13317 [Operophtera brumata]